MAGENAISYIIYHTSYIIYHISYIIYHISYIIYHISYIIYHISYIIYHISYIIYRISYIIYHISYIIYHISYIIYHISYIIYHISYIIYHIYHISYIISHHITSVTSRHVTSRHVTSRHVTSRHVTSRHVMYNEKAINDFSNRFIDEISIWKTFTYATKQLGFEKVIEHQRNCALAILQERDVFMAKPTGSDVINDYQTISLLQDYMNLVSLKGNWTEMKFALVVTPLISLVKDQTRQLRERNIDVILLFAENSMRLFRRYQDKIPPGQTPLDKIPPRTKSPGQNPPRTKSPPVYFIFY